MAAVPESLFVENSHLPFDSDLVDLAVSIEPLSASHTINDVSTLFLAPQTHQLLSLPVVRDGRPIGIISRYELMKVYVKLYGREVYGRRSVTELMNPVPLLVPMQASVETIAQRIIEHMQFPVTDDFVIVDEDGRYLGMGVVIDVLKAMEQRVERKNKELAHAYEILKSSQTRLIQSEKMASLGQMVAGVAHEINTPLGYVRNNVDLLQDFVRQASELISAQNKALDLLLSQRPDEDLLLDALRESERLRTELPAEMLLDMTDLLRDTLYGTEQISELVVNLRNFSRLDQAKVERVNLNDCLDSALVIARNNIKRKATVSKQYSDIPHVHCSPSQINQVFLNLLNNAAQAIDSSGEIIVRTWVDAHGYVCASVSDNGKGIAPEHLPKIFDPFFTTKPVGEGTGLGLSISYQILEQHQGRIEVESSIGQGTTFTVRLPKSGLPTKGESS